MGETPKPPAQLVTMGETPKPPAQPVFRRALGLLLGLLARAWLSSLRLTLIVDPALAAARPRPFALTFWHGQQFALLCWARTQRIVALVSRSRDGELVAAALARLGIASARGSSSRGG